MNGKATAYRIVLAQGATAVVVSLGFLGFSGAWAGASALLGGIVSVVGNLLFARVSFAARAARSPQQMVRAFYLGEMVKLLITAGLFTVAIVPLAAAPVPLLSGYAATLLVFWLALLRPGAFDAARSRR